MPDAALQSPLKTIANAAAAGTNSIAAASGGLSAAFVSFRHYQVGDPHL